MDKDNGCGDGDHPSILFTCDLCGKNAILNTTIEKAEASAKTEFGVENAFTNPAMMMVCESCFRWVMEKK